MGVATGALGKKAQKKRNMGARTLEKEKRRLVLGAGALEIVKTIAKLNDWLFCICYLLFTDYFLLCVFDIMSLVQRKGWETYTELVEK